MAESPDGDAVNSSIETLRLTDWLENQKERAKERMHDERLDAEKQAEWKGEYQLIRSIQHYIEHGVLELE